MVKFSRNVVTFMTVYYLTRLIYQDLGLGLYVIHSVTC
jgi:hypothetical protein